MNGQDAFDAILDKLDTALRAEAGLRAMHGDIASRLGQAESDRDRYRDSSVMWRERAAMWEAALNEKGADTAKIERVTVVKMALADTLPAPKAYDDMPF